MPVTVKNVGTAFSGEYIAEQVHHRFSLEEGYTTDFILKRNMLNEEFGKKGGFVDNYANAFLQERIKSRQDSGNENENENEESMEDETRTVRIELGKGSSDGLMDN
jgi:hypothetical protein